jgi:hypothetical protein
MKNLNYYIFFAFLTGIVVYYFAFYKTGGLKNLGSGSGSGNGGGNSGGSGSGSDRINYNGKYYFDWIGSGYGPIGPNNDISTPGFHIIKTDIDAPIPKTISDNITKNSRIGVYKITGEKVGEYDTYEKQPSPEGKKSGYPDIITVAASDQQIKNQIYERRENEPSGYLKVE